MCPIQTKLRRIQQPANRFHVGSPPTLSCIINIAEFWESAKSYEYLIKKDELLEDPEELQKFE